MTRVTAPRRYGHLEFVSMTLFGMGEIILDLRWVLKPMSDALRREKQRGTETQTHRHKRCRR